MSALDELRRRTRVLALLDALTQASIFAAPLRVLHELAYLANVLAPVFDLTPFSASVLKRRGGPYYPDLQQTLDLLVGSGLVLVSEVRHVFVQEENRYRLDALYSINDELAAPAIQRYQEVYASTSEPLFLAELAAAYGMLSDNELGRATRFDARYSYADVDTNEVIDFGEWKTAAASNFSRNAAMAFRPHDSLQPAERLYMYMEHVQRRAARG